MPCSNSCVMVSYLQLVPGQAPHGHKHTQDCYCYTNLGVQGVSMIVSVGVQDGHLPDDHHDGVWEGHDQGPDLACSTKPAGDNDPVDEPVEKQIERSKVHDVLNVRVHSLKKKSLK